MQFSPSFRVSSPERFVLSSFALHVDLYGPVRARLRGGQAAHEQPALVRAVDAMLA